MRWQFWLGLAQTGPFCSPRTQPIGHLRNARFARFCSVRTAPRKSPVWSPLIRHFQNENFWQKISKISRPPKNFSWPPSKILELAIQNSGIRPNFSIEASRAKMAKLPKWAKVLQNCQNGQVRSFLATLEGVEACHRRALACPGPREHPARDLLTCQIGQTTRQDRTTHASVTRAHGARHVILGCPTHAKWGVSGQVPPEQGASPYPQMGTFQNFILLLLSSSIFQK